MRNSFEKAQNATTLLIRAFLICLGLTACNDSGSFPDSITNIDNSVMNQEQQNAVSLLKLYFGGELVLHELKRGPAGTIVIRAQSKSDSLTHLLYMLPDQQHLIDGTLYSPHMTADQISAAHSQVTQSMAAMNESIASSKEQMRKAISSAITNGESPDKIKSATAHAVEERVRSTSNAKRTHNLNVLSSLSPVINPSATASLPRNNTVVNKEDLYKRIEASNWISDGDSKKIIYVFFDFRCPACAEVHKYLDEHVAKNEVQVRYVPVGALGPESLVRASLSLIPERNETRLKLMHLLSKSQNLPELIKDRPSQEELKKGQMAALLNFKLLMETQRVATPTFAYRTDAGPQITALSSRVQLTEVINNLASP